MKNPKSSNSNHPVNEENHSPKPTLWSMIPDETIQQIKDCTILELCFAAGPGYCARKLEICSPPMPLEYAEDWLEQHRSSWRKAHVYLSDTSTLWFEREKFMYRKMDFDESLRRPGLVIRQR
jgi:hypothetical protein